MITIIDTDLVYLHNYVSDDHGRFVKTSSRSLMHVYPPLRKDLIPDN